MRGILVTALISLAASSALAEDWTCPADTDTCRYVVNTGETAKVGAGGGGHTADLGVWVHAAPGQVLANQRVWVVSQNGVRVACEFQGTKGEQTLNVGGFTVKVYSAFLVRAHAETGSGGQAIGRTAHMQCGFEAQQKKT